MSVKDEIARLRAEAKRFREMAKARRADSKAAKERCDWLAKLKADERVREYVRAAQSCDERIKELRGSP